MRDHLAGILAARGVVGCRVALLDFPDHRNVGDSLIWAATSRMLAKLGCTVEYAADAATFEPTVMEDALGPSDPVLITGGGNLGDLWPRHEAFRERVVQACAHRVVVQLPQSIWFDSDTATQRAVAVLGAHPRFTLLVRDRASQIRAHDQLGLDAVLVPDVAMTARASDLPRRLRPRQPVLWLGRGDVERSPAVQAPSHASLVPQREDWVDGGGWPNGVEAVASRLRVARRRLARAQRLGGKGAAVVRSAHVRVAAALARSEVARGARLLARGEVVVTDRLHAHVLAHGLGIPTIVLDNRYGKVHACVNEWHAGAPGTYLVHDIEEAFALARRLVA